MNSLQIQDIKEAHERIRPYIHRTMVLTCATLDRMAGARLCFKCENFQKIGAFKIRGATNAVMSLSDQEAACGVITHSSGNHGAAVAQAARWRGIKATVIMPQNSAEVKKQAVAGYGAEVIFCQPSIDDRQRQTDIVMDKTNATMIHPYNDFRIMAGAGTAGLELLEDTDGLDMLLIPVGGGGLISGCAVASSNVSPDTVVLGAEPENADDARLSLIEGHIMPVKKAHTIADGLRTNLGGKTFSVIQKHVRDIYTATEQQIIDAMRLIWQRMKLVVEPSSAVPLAVILAHPQVFTGKRVGIVISGGNVDLDALPWIEQ